MYNPILNSSLLKQLGDAEVGSFNQLFNNTALRIGAITEVIETDNDLNQNKIIPEYTVVCVEQDENRGMTTTIYKNCVSVDTFGSIADFVRFKRRTPKNPDFKNKVDFKQQDSNLVLLLCLDGNSERAVIIGGLPHPASKAILDKAKEMHFESEYNGLNIQINKDGAFTLTFKGPTDNQGQPTTKNGDTTFKIEKDGSFEVNDNKGDSIRLDKTNQTLNVKTEKDQSYTTGANYNLTAKENGSISVKDMLIKASGSASFSSASSFNITSEGSLDVKASSMSMDSSGLVKVKGSQITLDGIVYLGGSGGSPALTSYTQMFGIGNLGAPVLSIPMGPYSSKVFVAN
jgi:hypothetical protein